MTAQDMPAWAFALVSLGYSLGRRDTGDFACRVVVVVPCRETATLWLALGGLLGGLEASCASDPEEGAKAWLMPRGQQKRFRPGKFLKVDDYGLWQVQLDKDASTESGPRDSIFFVESAPTIKGAKSVQWLVELAHAIGVRIRADQCLAAEEAVLVAGSALHLGDVLERTEIKGRTLKELLLWGTGASRTFCLTRLVGDASEISDNSRLLAVDGYKDFEILEHDALQDSMLPAVVVLTEDEWYFAQRTDSDRVRNALSNWGGSRCEWPVGLPQPGLGGLIYRKKRAR